MQPRSKKITTKHKIAASHSTTATTLVARFNAATPFEEVKLEITKALQGLDPTAEPPKKKIRIISKLPFSNKQNEFIPPEESDAGTKHSYYYFSAEPDFYLKDDELGTKLKGLNVYNSKDFRVNEIIKVTNFNRDVPLTRADMIKHYATLSLQWRDLENKLCAKIDGLENHLPYS